MVLYTATIIQAKSHAQTSITMRSVEDEYEACSNAEKIVAWLRQQLDGLDIRQSPTITFHDNRGPQMDKC